MHTWGVLYLDVDVLLFRNPVSWLRGARVELESAPLACGQLPKSPPAGLRRCSNVNTGWVFVPLRTSSQLRATRSRPPHPNRAEAEFEDTQSLLEKWVAGARSGLAVHPAWGDQQALNQLLSQSRAEVLCLPIEQFPVCGRRHADSVAVHFNTGSGRNFQCNGTGFESEHVFDDRVKVRAMQQAGVWRPTSASCTDIDALERRAQVGHLRPRTLSFSPWG